jgi:hypothetical protein
MSMHVKQWIANLRKSVSSKKSPLRSPRVAQVAAVSLVVLMTVGALVFAAHQATPSADAAPVAKAVTARTTVPAANTNVAKAHPANAARAGQVSEPVTITGCLEGKDNTFRLKDTGGPEAPKSRSWKSGFIKKHSATVTVLDGTNRMKLGSHVGERVSVTGMLVDKELQGRSIRRVTASCE